MATFADRFAEALRVRHITAAELSRKLNISEGTLSQYKKGSYEPKQKRTEALAKALNVSIPWLMGADVPMGYYDDNKTSLQPLPSQNVFMRPLYDSVAAGFGVPAVNQIVSYIPTFINNVAEKDKYIWVRVEGDSMAPKIESGDKILIRLQESLDSGQIGVALINGEDAVVKKINYGDNWIELESFNPYYPPRRFEGADVQQIRVVGLVREVSKELQ